jgi:hypothetical protein
VMPIVRGAPSSVSIRLSEELELLICRLSAELIN